MANVVFDAPAFPMIDRRELLTGALGLTGGMAISARVAAADPPTPYQLAAQSTWAPMRVDPGKLELVRFACRQQPQHATVEILDQE
jgi:hypothetical protein